MYNNISIIIDFCEARVTSKNVTTTTIHHAHIRTLKANELAKSLTEFRVEESVNDRVDKAVHVSEPRGRYESCYPGLAILLHFGTQGIHDVAREEGHPAY